MHTVVHTRRKSRQLCGDILFVFILFNIYSSCFGANSTSTTPKSIRRFQHLNAITPLIVLGIFMILILSLIALLIFYRKRLDALQQIVNRRDGLTGMGGVSHSITVRCINIENDLPPTYEEIQKVTEDPPPPCFCAAILMIKHSTEEFKSDCESDQEFICTCCH